MEIVRFFFIGLMILVFVGNAFGRINVGQRNFTDNLQSRMKRGIIFENGGIIKLVLGPIIGIPFEDPVPWRSIICGYNIHIGEFRLPTTPLYPWDKWETIYARSQRSAQMEPDESREFIYLALEHFLEKTRGSGHACLLRLICENAQIDHQMDTFGEIFNVILTPGKENLDPAYKAAKEVGQSGADCLQFYRQCPKGKHFFDQFIEDDV